MAGLLEIAALRYGPRFSCRISATFYLGSVETVDCFLAFSPVTLSVKGLKLNSSWLLSDPFRGFSYLNKPQINK